MYNTLIFGLSYIHLYSSPSTGMLRTHKVTSSQLPEFFAGFNFTTAYITALISHFFKCCDMLRRSVAIVLTTSKGVLGGLINGEGVIYPGVYKRF